MLQLHEMNVDGYYRVVRGTDETTGLDAFIAIHNINLGPALGGCRAMPYTAAVKAAEDVLRLSKGMTYKSALAGLNLGGGKSVINTADLTEDKLKSFAEMLNAVNNSGDVYFTAGDIGTSPSHLDVLAKYTRYVNTGGGKDSGEATAFGVFCAADGALNVRDRMWRTSRVSISGLGKVGRRLAKLVKGTEPIDMFLSDIDSWAKRQAVMSIGGSMASPETAHVGVEVYMPCAIGGIVNERTIGEMNKGTIICGAANNQLDTDEATAFMSSRGITYVPDYLANAGGVIIVSTRNDEMTDLDYNDPEVKPKLEALAQTTKEIILEADATGKSTVSVANKLAEERFNV